MKFNLLKILRETFNTKSKIQWDKSESNDIGFFKIDKTDYFIKIDKLLPNKFPQIKKLNKKIVNLTFGDLDENGYPNVDATNKNEAHLRTIGIVKNAAYDYVLENQIDIILFTAKGGDGHFSSRSSLYSMICSSIRKQLNFHTFEIETLNAKTFCLSKEKFTNQEKRLIKKEVTDTTSFKDKIK